MKKTLMFCYFFPHISIVVCKSVIILILGYITVDIPLPWLSRGSI